MESAWDVADGRWDVQEIPWHAEFIPGSRMWAPKILYHRDGMVTTVTGRGADTGLV